MKKLLVAALCTITVMAASAAPAASESKTKPHTMAGQMMLYQMKDYNGEDYVIEGARTSVSLDWNIKSIAVHPGEKWEICVKPRFKEPCIILDRSVPDAKMIGIEGGIGSARPAAAAQ